MFENEGHTENGCRTPKIGVLDHLFGISVLYTLVRFTSFIFNREFLSFTMQKTMIKKKTKIADFYKFYHFFSVFDGFCTL